uniref:NADH-ubiquinone oxidoreductase chain 4L n=1 Tax=Allothyrus sp. LamingtonNP-QMS95173 TaxID=1442165 RepID=W0FGL7_9ACAR|nr:NADH dehydrogenase subunit 4L [Allothyrus sp. LamingtonNP-QMS95173]
MMMMSLIIFILGMFSLMFNRIHLLSMLLSFEFMMLGSFFFLFNLMCMLGQITSIIIFLVMVVCEASLGLSLLVLSVYFYGNDYVKSLGMLKC